MHEQKFNSLVERLKDDLGGVFCLEDLQYEIDSFTRQYVEYHTVDVSSCRIGFGISSSVTVYADLDEELVFICKQEVERANYYLGFEYIDSDEYYELGQYRIYKNENERISAILDKVRELYENENERIRSAILDKVRELQEEQA